MIDPDNADLSDSDDDSSRFGKAYSPPDSPFNSDISDSDDSEDEVDNMSTDVNTVNTTTVNDVDEDGDVEMVEVSPFLKVFDINNHSRRPLLKRSHMAANSGQYFGDNRSIINNYS